MNKKEVKRLLASIFIYISILGIGVITGCIDNDTAKRDSAIRTLPDQEAGKRIEVGGSVTPDIFDATAMFYIRERNQESTSDWVKFATKTEKGRGRGVWASRYVTLPDANAFVEIKAIVAHPNYYDCETRPVRFDWNSGGGVRMLSGCSTMHADYRK